jgi:Putative auto-transporter adhesin, head GIN domain
MKKFILTMLAMISLYTGYSQNKDNNRETRNVPAFHGVDVSGGVDLYITNGPASVSVSAANSNIRSHMVTEVVNGNLQIHLEKNWHPDESSPNMKAYVSATGLDQLGASGGGDIYIEKELTAGTLQIHLSGGGNMEGKLTAEHLNINQSGGSSVKLTGNVKDLNLESSGGGSLEGYQLITDYASIHASGGSNSQITVNKELRVVSSGGCEVSYKGTASVKEIKTSGGGSVTHKD